MRRVFFKDCLEAKNELAMILHKKNTVLGDIANTEKENKTLESDLVNINEEMKKLKMKEKEAKEEAEARAKTQVINIFSPYCL